MFRVLHLPLGQSHNRTKKGSPALCICVYVCVRARLSFLGRALLCQFLCVEELKNRGGGFLSSFFSFFLFLLLFLSFSFFFSFFLSFFFLPFFLYFSSFSHSFFLLLFVHSFLLDLRGFRAPAPRPGGGVLGREGIARTPWEMEGRGEERGGE